jgi:starch phosphorylase
MSILTSHDRPVQVVIAGKAHPHDDGGKEMIRDLIRFASDPEARARLAFIENYDMEVGRMLTQGADVWLNNPRRPLEACGTSGMKAALNGALNCSVLDGWWDECYDGNNGWAIGSRQTHPDLELQDRIDANALYELLDRVITTAFYDRPEGPVPRRWVERMKASISSIGRFVTADRMVRDYTEHLYEPASRQGDSLSAGRYDGARELSRWKARVRKQWDGLEIVDVEGDATAADVGDMRSVEARVRLGTLGTGDIMVQLAHGRVGANGELVDPEIVAMQPTESIDGIQNYRGEFAADAAGLYGFAVRVIPAHDDLASTMDLGLITWG